MSSRKGAMTKGEAQETHLRLALATGATVPTPDVFDIRESPYFQSNYPKVFTEMPAHRIKMQEEDLPHVEDDPEYDMDDEDEAWLEAGAQQLTPEQFEQMIDQLEAGSDQTTLITLEQAKAVIQEDADLVQVVYDYWLNKRQRLNHQMIPKVPNKPWPGVTDKHPYIAFQNQVEWEVNKLRVLNQGLTSKVALVDKEIEEATSRKQILQQKLEQFKKRFTEKADSSVQLDPKAEKQSSGLENDLEATTEEDGMEVDDVPTMDIPEPAQASVSTEEASGSVMVPALYGAEANVAMAVSPAPSSASTDEENPPLYHYPVDSDKWPWGAEDKRLHTYYPTGMQTKNGMRYIGLCRRRIGRGGRTVIERINCEGGEQLWETVASESMEVNYTQASSDDNDEDIENTFAENRVYF